MMKLLNINRLKQNFSELTWVSVGQAASVIGTLFLVRILTKHLDPIQYGQLALGLSVALVANQVLIGGLSAGISRFYSVAAEKQDLLGYLRASKHLLFYATLISIVLGMALIFGLLWLDYSQWIWFTVATLIFTILSGYSSTLNGIQAAARQRAIVAVHGGLEAWLKIPLVMCVWRWFDKSNTALVLCYALSSLFVICSQFFFLRRMLSKNNPSNEENNQWMRRILAYSWPFSTWGVFTWAQQSSDRWALNTFATTREVGLYTVLFQLGYTPISMVTGLAVSFIGPILYQRSGNATDTVRNASVHQLAWRITLISIFVTLIGFVSAFGLHGLIFRILVASEYRSVSYLLPWMVLAGGLFASGQMLSLKIMSDMKPTKLIGVKIVTALLGVLLNTYFASVAGLTGVVVGMVAFSSIYFAWMVVRSFRGSVGNLVSGLI